MVPIDRLAQSTPAHVRIYFGGREVRMPQHHLDRTQIRSPFEQIRRKSMAQYVR